MDKIKYLRKYLFETDKHFESRVNKTLNAISSNPDMKISTIISDIRYVVIMYTEKVNVNISKTQVKGFCLTSNDI